VNWSQLDFPTRAACIAGVVALVGVVIPPFSVASAGVAVVFSVVALLRARRRGEPNRTAGVCLFGSMGWIAVIVIGNAIYAAA
jgi:hypothetical protein